MKRLVVIAVLAVAGIVCAIEFKGVTNLQEPRPVNFQCWQGETLTIMPVLESFQRPVVPSAASFHWQTNGMDFLCWSKPAEVMPDGRIVAVFHPTNDCGAASYEYFIRAEIGDGIAYRTFGTIMMRKSPGFVPNTLPMPVPSLDFDLIQYLNAPWLLPSALDGYATEAWVENYVAENAPALTEADPVALPVAVAAGNLATQAMA